MYAEVKDGSLVTFPYTYDTLVLKNPNTRFSQDHLLDMYRDTEDNLAGNELVFVVQEDQPAYDRKTQVVELNSQPTQINGVWTLSWSVIALTAEQQSQVTSDEATSIRNKRNELLSNSDWTQGKDIPENISSAWAVYRQALRDIPEQQGFPWNVQWPTV